MAEVLEETLTTKEETTTHGKRQTKRSTSGKIPKKQWSTRRKASQATEAAGAPENGATNQHPGNHGTAPTGNSEAGESAIERLIDAVSKALAKDCEMLSRKLAERAIEGHVSAFRLLVMLAERKKPRVVPVKKPHRLTLAQMLAMEPQWKGDEPEQQTAEFGGAGESVKAGG